MVALRRISRWDQNWKWYGEHMKQSLTVCSTTTWWPCEETVVEIKIGSDTVNTWNNHLLSAALQHGGRAKNLSFEIKIGSDTVNTWNNHLLSAAPQHGGLAKNLSFEIKIGSDTVNTWNNHLLSAAPQHGSRAKKLSLRSKLEAIRWTHETITYCLQHHNMVAMRRISRLRWKLEVIRWTHETIEVLRQQIQIKLQVMFLSRLILKWFMVFYLKILCSQSCCGMMLGSGNRVGLCKCANITSIKVDSQNRWERTDKTTINTRIAGHLAEIRTRYHPNMCPLQHQCRNDRLGIFLSPGKS